MERIQVDRWISDRSFHLLHVSGVSKSVTTYYPSMNFDAAVWVAEKSEELGLTGIPDLVTIALCVGAYSRLWVGELEGTIAPMDVAPEGWMYPSLKAAESSWFWQWTPSQRSEEILLSELEDSNPLNSFKNLVPFQLQRKHGAIAQINAIDLIRLPDIVRSGVPFLFETEN